MSAELIEIRVNGKDRPAQPGMSVAGLLEELGHHPRTVAIEHNGAILKREKFGQTELGDGDRLEIVRFVQGG